MKRNKMRLVAVAMSAMLAAGMIPVGAYGEELTAGDEVAVEEVVVADEAVEDAGETGNKVDENSFTWDYENLKVTYRTQNSTIDRTADCEMDIIQKPTCTEPGKYILKAYLVDEDWWYSSDKEAQELKALGHDMKKVDTIITQHPTCTEDGAGYELWECQRAGCEYSEQREIPYALEATGHKWGPNQVRYTNLKNVEELDDGTLVLIDETMDGTYTEETYHVCTNVDKNGTEEVPCEEEEIVKSVDKTIYSKKVTEAIITDQKGIADELTGMTMSEFREEFPTDFDIELENCNKAGSYEVTYYNKEGKPTSHKWFTVRVHHMLTGEVVEFKNADDEKLCTVDPETLKVTNHSCYKDVTYYVVDHCDAKGCPNKPCDTKKYLCHNTDEKEVSREEKVAAPEGDHIINTTVEKTVVEMMEEEYADVDALVELEKKEDSFIKLSKNTATCTEDGTITVTFLCKVCKAEVKSYTLDTEALGHDPDKAVGENVVAPTCESEGSYDAVIYCKRCGEVLQKREGVKIPRIPHTNEISVDAEGNGVDDTDTDEGAYIVWEGDKVVEAELENGAYLDYPEIEGNIVGPADRKFFSVTAKLATNCTRCGNHEVIIDATPEVEILDIQKEGLTCEFGYITIGASYETEDGEEVYDTYTVPYWTSMEAYEGRTAHTALPPVEEVREDGTYVVIRCQICGTVIYEQKIKDAEGKEYKDGLVQDDDGVWRYYEEDKFASDFTGIAPYNTGEFFVGNGVLCSDANGLNLYDGTWYFLSQGQIQRGYDGFALYDGSWFIIKNGELDEGANGLFDYNGGKFLFAAGKLQDQVNGLWQDADGTWYFLANGQVQTQFSGVAEYDGAFFVVKDGVFQADYSGPIEYDGHMFNVVKGQLYGEVAA